MILLLPGLEAEVYISLAVSDHLCLPLEAESKGNYVHIQSMPYSVIIFLCLLYNLFDFIPQITTQYSNTILMPYEGGGYGNGGLLGNSLFPRYTHHKLNLNALKNFG